MNNVSIMSVFCCRYFFKTHTDNNDFDSDVVWEEIKEDSCILPLFEGKVVAKVEKID